MSSTHSPPVSPAWSGSRRPSQRSSGPKSPSDPPRSARDGFEWVWYPEGYWAERPLERRRSSNKSQSSSTVGKKILSWAPRSKHSPKDRAHGALERPMTPVDIDSDHEVLLSPRGFSSISPISQQPRLSHFMPARGLPQSPYLSEQEQVAALQNPAFITAREHVDSEDTWKSSSPVGESAEGETAAPRRGTMAAIAPRSLWMSMHNHRVKFEEPPPERSDGSSTPAPTPDATPSYFTQKPIRAPSVTPPEQDDEEEDAYESPVKSQPLPTPWPEHTSRTTSSKGPKGLRKWLMKIPRSRKDPGSTQNGTSYAKDKTVDDSSSSSPAGSSITRFNREVFIQGSTKSYPAGEAQHVETPPLKQQTANGQPRSLFMEIKHSLPLDHLDDAGSSSSESLRATPRVFSYRKNQLIAKREWWDAPKAPVRRDPVRDVSFFEFNMPEHLPSSPMCPANPLHKGKLKVCVYHGRRKQQSVDESVGIEGDGEEGKGDTGSL